MKKESAKIHLNYRRIPAIVAVGSSLAAFPAVALELGDISVQSRLGQPLRASIAYALAPNEQISDQCVTMRPGASLSGLPAAGITRITVSNGVILLAGETPMRNPIVSAHVVVNCPYTANLSREYLAFIDPLNAPYAQIEVTQQTAPQSAPVSIAPTAAQPAPTAAQPAPTAAQPAAVTKQSVVKDIQTSTTYEVQPGESLSKIARRIENRGVGLWPALEAIFAANPDAFINNDPNLLKAGSLLEIPSFDGNPVVIADETALTAYSYAQQYVPETTVVSATPESPASIEESVVVEESPFIEESPAEQIAADMTSDLKPGHIILDAVLPGPTTNSASPNVPTAIITTTNSANERSASPSWFIWLAGSGVAIVFGLIMFSRRMRGNTGTSPAAPMLDDAPRRRVSDTEQTDTEQTDTEQTDTENIAALSVDYDLSDDSPTDQNLVLDADVVVGTGLSAGVQTDDYDMSVIIDETPISQNHAINKEVDYQVLAQDYEDEMTATQAVDKEIRAAAELLGNINNDAADSDETPAPPLASVTELYVTTQAPAQNDDVAEANPDATGVNETMTVNTSVDDKTVEMPVGGKAK